jgi:hypothetical protein
MSMPNLGDGGRRTLAGITGREPHSGAHAHPHEHPDLAAAVADHDGRLRAIENLFTPDADCAEDVTDLIGGPPVPSGGTNDHVAMLEP